MACSNLSEAEKTQILSAMIKITKEGFRVLGVGVDDFPDSNYPKTQQEFNFTFLGLVAFYDPPKANIQVVFF